MDTVRSIAEESGPGPSASPDAHMSASRQHDAPDPGTLDELPPVQEDAARSAEPQQEQQAAPPAEQHRAKQKRRRPRQQTRTSPRSVKRPRPVRSCFECRKRKLRCDRLYPCSQCQKSARLCKYTADHHEGGATLSEASEADVGDTSGPSLKKRRVATVGEVDTGLERPSTPAASGEWSFVPLLEEMAGRMERLEKHILRGEDPGETDNAAGSWRRTVEVSSANMGGISVKDGGSRSRFHGSASRRRLLDLFDEAKDFMSHHSENHHARNVFASFTKLRKLLRTEFRESVTPITVYVDSMMPIQKRMADILPKKHICDDLLRGYLENNENLYRVIHVPTFLGQYDRYWEGGPQSEAFLPGLLGVLCIASHFEIRPSGHSHERPGGVHLPTAAALLRLWLNSLSTKRLVEMETLQVELLWLLAMRRIREHSRDGWTQLGAIIRMAMAMGLHRDPSEFGSRITPFIGEMRRRLWATIADLDYCVSRDCNLPSLLRAEDATAVPPRNLDDDDLHPDMEELPPGKPFDQVTDNQVQAYAATTFGLRKRVAEYIDRVDRVRDWSEIEDVGSQLEKRLEELDSSPPRTLTGDDASTSRAWRHRGLLETQLRRSLLHLYRPFVPGVADIPPHILRSHLRHLDAIINGFEDEGWGAQPGVRIEYEGIPGPPWIGTKNDIAQAALSICYYIRAAMHPEADDATTVSVRKALHAPQDESVQPGGEAAIGVVWSAERLAISVEKVMDSLVRTAERGDIQDIVCLAIVLESVRRPEPRAEDITLRLQNVLDSCLRSVNCTLARLASVSVSEMAQGRAQHQQADAYGAPSESSPWATRSMPSEKGEEDGWAFWYGWD